MDAVNRFRNDSRPLAAKAKKANRVGKATKLVITASRKTGGERAEWVDGESDKAATAAAATPAQRSWHYDETELNHFTDLLRQLDDAQQAGQPTALLRQALRQAYQRMKTVKQ
jgi:hypothetical protein